MDQEVMGTAIVLSMEQRRQELQDLVAGAIRGAVACSKARAIGPERWALESFLIRVTEDCEG